MSEKVILVAKAIRDVNANTRGLSFIELSEAMAIAAIQAMHMPTPEMFDAGCRVCDDFCPHGCAADKIFNGMLTASLSDSLPTPAATPADSANPPPVESVGPNSEAQS